MVYDIFIQDIIRNVKGVSILAGPLNSTELLKPLLVRTKSKATQADNPIKENVLFS